MRVIVQFAAEAGEVPPIVEIDHADWDSLPSVYINAVCVQGLWIKGCDHYQIRDIAGVCTVYGWSDDPAQWAGNRWAHVFEFPELAPDPKFGGRLNTGIVGRWYAEGANLLAIPGALPYAMFEAPETGIRRHGIQLDDLRYAAHIANLPRVHWRDWE